MAILKNWDPLNLPKGSIRAVVTLALVGTLWALMLLGREIPVVYIGLIFLVLGYYFGSRSGTVVSAAEKTPLSLPAGTIRTLIVIGFAVVGFLLWRDARLTLTVDDRNTMILCIVGAMCVGVILRNVADLLSRGEATRLRRWAENAKSVLVLSAVALLMFLTLSQDGANGGTKNLVLLLVSIVGFYFGSR